MTKIFIKSKKIIIEKKKGGEGDGTLPFLFSPFQGKKGGGGTLLKSF